MSPLSAITTFWKDHGYAPTVREVATLTGRSVGWTHEQLERLRDAGIVDWVDGQARTLRITQ